mmetsp:Transcript_5742/g.16117  ORF Transcript_5742/g.16117 Transcript_5742/m.16117 type:complete len:80 (+) Transcript_5742:114-353(+)
MASTMFKCCTPTAAVAAKSVRDSKSLSGKAIPARAARPSAAGARRSVAVQAAESTTFDNYKFAPIRESQVSREMTSRGA